MSTYSQCATLTMHLEMQMYLCSHLECGFAVHVKGEAHSWNSCLMFPVAKKLPWMQSAVE